MAQDNLTASILSAIEEELKQQLSQQGINIPSSFREILTYHLGWTGEGHGSQTTGKRIRPLLLLLITSACNNDWRFSLPAAAAIELIHNFSLIHDDIQDTSLLRRGRSTVWAKWGIPKAINAGDALFSLANKSMTNLSTYHHESDILLATQIIHQACLDLTIGQHLDMESQDNIYFSLEDYWRMIEAKTASLFSAAAEIGAIMAQTNNNIPPMYKEFGKQLGLAFQIQDDYLGIWGNDTVIGKSTISDISEKKRTYPILLGLQKSKEFSELWKLDRKSQLDIDRMINILENEGIKEITRNIISDLSNLAMDTLLNIHPLGYAGEELILIVKKLEIRVK